MIIKYFSPSMAPNTKEDDVQTGSWLCSEESGTDEEMDSKKKQRFGFGILKKSHEGSREGELLCDKAVPAANQALSHQNTCTYMMTGTVSRRVIYTLTLHPAESFALSVTGAWISWCACGWTLLFFFFSTLVTDVLSPTMPFDQNVMIMLHPNPLCWLADRA